ncbi:ABC transporter permease [Cohnella faecalis]|uniref:Sugar ABC transporter permease n=1 Tax=Cohnella faecalis TaxID=2315694 RepID=A0A398CXI4_9BACL|nr:ABC transporter permease subunit [Cohnella faecalis]RIE03694.1 sugar ABC transporter permease [Cohnella faecalis]
MKPLAKIGRGVSRFWLSQSPLYMMLLPGMLLLFLFSYMPMFGLVMAFTDFKPRLGFFGSPYVGLKWFDYLFNSSPDFSQVLTNTIVISLLKIAFGTAASLVFALLLNEAVVKWFKSAVQTITYLPNFLSWVVVGGMFIDILSQDGIINRILHAFGSPGVFFLGSNHWFRSVIVATDVWKNFGFGAVLYIAAIASINRDLYEACVVDGGGRFQQMRHVTLPGIMPTLIMLTTLNLGQIMNAMNGGQDQILVLYNPSVYETGDILDTFAYRTGIIDVQYSFATAVGLFKSVVGLVLIVSANRLSIKYASRRIF